MTLTPERFMKKRLAGLLTCPRRGAFPFLAYRNSGRGITAPFFRTYSSGYCPGFSPGSLLASKSFSLMNQTRCKVK